MGAKDQLGRYGEDLATEHLVSSGLVVLERNWRCRIGEIDIVALEGLTLVVCEVKTRRGLAFGSPVEAVTDRKLRRLRALAAQWVHDHDMRPAAIRVDVIGVLAEPGAPVRVQHLRGVIG